MLQSATSFKRFFSWETFIQLIFTKCDSDCKAIQRFKILFSFFSIWKMKYSKKEQNIKHVLEVFIGFAKMQDMMKERNMDSGLIVVVFIITSLIITVFSFLLFVDYEWCHVLFKNNTVRKNFKLCWNFTSMYFLLVACQMHLWGQSNFWFHQVLSIYLVVAVFWCWKSNYTTHCNDISQPFFQQHKKNVLLYNPVLFPQPL